MDFHSVNISRTRDILARVVIGYETKYSFPEGAADFWCYTVCYVLVERIHAYSQIFKLLMSASFAYSSHFAIAVFKRCVIRSFSLSIKHVVCSS